MINKFLQGSLLTLFTTLSVNTFAGTGDTTTVSSHINQKLSWYENYDSSITFPKGDKSYRRILMEFELGKYLCSETYDPAKAGEISDGRTGWCSDWDYDLHIILMNEAGDTFKLGELITPYANSTMPRLPLDWKHKYYYDVTDYYPYLTDDAKIRIFYAGWSGGFTGTVKFHFIEGERTRDVVKILPLYNKTVKYGISSLPLKDSIAPIEDTYPKNAEDAQVRVIISGHGSDATGCSEFCSKWYQFLVNDKEVAKRNIWSECGNNWLYPQSGTWVYDRANWCPGNAVVPIYHQLPSLEKDSKNTYDIEFQNYTSSAAIDNAPAYKISADVIYYGKYNNNNDITLEAITSPNNNEEYFRNQGYCSNPEILVKNNGGNDITSLEIKYGVGTASKVYNWTGVIKPNQLTSVTIPDQYVGTESLNTFTVEISKVNNEVDPYNADNILTSEFIKSNVIEGGNLNLQMKLSNNSRGSVNRTKWTIIDNATNTVVKTFTGTAASTIYSDTIQLANGCYTLEVDASYLGYGLRNPYIFSSPGYFRLFDANKNSRILIPQNDLGSSAYQGNLESYFGDGFKYSFIVDKSTLAINNDYKNNNINIYPNPASNELTIQLNDNYKQDSKVIIYNTVGQIVLQQELLHSTNSINLNAISSGYYQIILHTDGKVFTEKLIINK